MILYSPALDEIILVHGMIQNPNGFVCFNIMASGLFNMTNEHFELFEWVYIGNIN